MRCIICALERKAGLNYRLKWICEECRLHIVMQTVDQYREQFKRLIKQTSMKSYE